MALHPRQPHNHTSRGTLEPRERILLHLPDFRGAAAFIEYDGDELVQVGPNRPEARRVRRPKSHIALTWIRPADDSTSQSRWPVGASVPSNIASTSLSANPVMGGPTLGSACRSTNARVVSHQTRSNSALEGVAPFDILPAP